jgi:hypothetical protein
MAGAWSVGADDLADIATALRYEEDGMRLRRQLAKELRQAVEPGVAAAKGQIMAMGSAGLPHDGEPLRAAIARQVKAQTRLTGKAAGVRVRVSTQGMPRGFRQAPRRTNRDGWRHPVFGNREVWVQQRGKPGWFDDPLQARRAEYRAAVERAVAGMGARISRGAR